MQPQYDPQVIEPKWQRVWEERRVFEASVDPSRRKYYCLEMFPYPSGRIHMGHVRNYSIGDVVARYKRMRGFNVLHPMGWDAFGMPAENAALSNKTHPAKWTLQNIDTMRAQLKRMGFSYDWRREVTTAVPEYYRWEQRIFLQMYEKGLAYKKRSTVNWCDRCETVLANEQVVHGACWRCASVVVPKPLDQWFLKITAYAKELLEGTYHLPGWPERVLIMQREWIGESEGAEVEFRLEGKEKVITVFTTRPDTLYGATFMSLAAEHPLVLELSKGTPQEKEVRYFVEKVARMDRTKRLPEKYEDEYEKEGVFTGAWCLNPLNGRRMPIYAANFVLMEYGTGAVMAVPAHDQRDFEFAKKYKIPIVVVIRPSSLEVLDPLTMKEAFVDPGIMVNSDPFNGISSEQAKGGIIRTLEEKGLGQKATQYRLRDWGISRQRYWGTPIPILYCPNCGMVPVPEEDLPVVLPTEVEFTGKGGSPLARVDEFLHLNCPQCKKGIARRETDTMDTFVESSWYFLRYCSPQYDKGPFDPKAVAYWMGAQKNQPQSGVEGATRAPGIDQYIGGIEHAVLHLLYARFFTKVLRDLGYLGPGRNEPFLNLLTQGMVIKDGAKMSKSKGNVVDPDYLIEKYGADTARLFSLFAAPPEKDLDWSDQGVEGMRRFLGRVYRLVHNWRPEDDLPPGPDRQVGESLLRNKTIKKVTEDVERFHFNTAIAAVMEYLNRLQSRGPRIARIDLETMALLLSPFVPHIAEELWEGLGHTGLVSEAAWPSWDETILAKEETRTVVIQVNGILRGSLEVAAGLSEEEVRELVRKEEKVQKYLAGKELVKVIYVPNRLINFVV